MGRRYCCVLKCPSRGSVSKRSMFTPPLKDPVMLKKWGEALKGHVAPSCCPFNGKTFVCELHFKPEQLDQLFTMKMPDGSTWTEKKDRTRLFAGAVPSLFTKDELNTRCFEVKAPKYNQTYIFDIEESCDDCGSQITEVEEDGSEVEEQHIEQEGREDEQEEVTDQDSRDGCIDLTDIKEDASSRIDDDDKIEIIFSEGVDDGTDHESDGGDDMTAEVSDCPPDPLEVQNLVRKSRDSHVRPAIYFTHEVQNERKNTPEQEIANPSQIDVRKILGPPETEKSVINDINEFSRLCRKYIATKLNKKGRPSLMDRYGLDPPTPESSEKSVYLYPTAKWDVETLVSHIDHVKLPSENWFCTAKDGSPTFLCWNENYSIHKKVIFEMKSLYPIVHLGDDVVSFSEIAKPGSIIEVNNILKLVDSAEKCPEKDPSVCKGYFFPAATNGVNMCHPCATELSSKSLDVQLFSFDIVKDSAQDIISNLHNWSVTVLGTSLIFIGWKKPYIPEKLYILNADLTVQVTFDEDSTLFGEFCSPQSIDDVRFAIKFLEECVKCIGVDNSHRSDRCRGFVHHETKRMRNKTCSACADLKKKLIRAVPGNRLVKHTRAKHSLSMGSLQLAAKSSPNWIKEEENSSDQTLEADEEHILLPNVLDAITLPSNRWTYAVVDNTVIFQYWKDNFTLLKKVLINHDLSVEISVLDRIVELENVDFVSSVDDVVRILNVVDCLKVCEGHDGLYRKDKDCTGYIYDPSDADSKSQATPYMCPKCAASRSAQIGSSLSKKSAAKNRIHIVGRKSDDCEPSSKKRALEIIMTPPFSPRPGYPGTPADDER